MYHKLCSVHTAASCTCSCWKQSAHCSTSVLCIESAINEFIQQNKSELQEINTESNTATSRGSNQDHQSISRKKSSGIKTTKQCQHNTVST
jgi:hypothetical protein